MRESNLYQRGGVYWLKAEVAGKQYRESLRTGDLKIARKSRDARLEQIRAEVWRGERRRTWGEAVAAWADHISGQLGESTLSRYATSFAQVEPYLSKLHIDEIDGRAIAGLIQARRALGATPATVRRDLTAVSRVLEYAEAMEWREGNPTLSKRRLLKERRDPIELPTEAAYAAVLSYTSRSFAALIVAARLTGCRQAELVNLTPSQFDPMTGNLDVIGKGNKRRTIRLSHAATAHFVRQSSAGRVMFPRKGDKPQNNTPNKFTLLCRNLLKRDPAFRRFRFHDLRHWFAVEALRGGMGIYALSKHLGHTSVKTTEIYLSFLTAAEAEAARESAQKPAQTDETKSSTN